MATEQFNPTTHLTTIRTSKGPQSYLAVKHRLMWLLAEHEDASVVTEQIEGSETHARFKATITYAGRMFTGHGSETRQDFADFYEKAETKAIGRACAVAGFGTDAAGDFDDGEPLDGLPAAKGERALRRAEDAPHAPTPIAAAPSAPSAAQRALGKRVAGPAPRPCKWADVVGALRADGWELTGTDAATIAADISYFYEEEDIPSTNPQGGWWPSDIWAFVAAKNAEQQGAAQ